MTEAPDTTTLTGAEFRREVGTDPAKWAEAFLDAAGSDQRASARRARLRSLPSGSATTLDACVAEAVRHTPWPSQPCPPTP